MLRYTLQKFCLITRDFVNFTAKVSSEIIMIITLKWTKNQSRPGNHSETNYISARKGQNTRRTVRYQYYENWLGSRDFQATGGVCVDCI